jgi:hypothetical protein
MMSKGDDGVQRGSWCAHRGALPLYPESVTEAEDIVVQINFNVDWKNSFGKSLGMKLS